MAPLGTDLHAGPALTVRLDAAGRVRGVEVHRLPDALRRPSALAAEFRAALAASAADRQPAAPLATDAAGRPVVHRLERPVTRTMRELVAAAPTRVRGPEVRSQPAVGGERGEAVNGLVAVTLDRSGPGGELAIEPAWLHRARIAAVGAAITEAFAAAYHLRDAR